MSRGAPPAVHRPPAVFPGPGPSRTLGPRPPFSAHTRLPLLASSSPGQASCARAQPPGSGGGGPASSSSREGPSGCLQPHGAPGSLACGHTPCLSHGLSRLCLSAPFLEGHWSLDWGAPSSTMAPSSLGNVCTNTVTLLFTNKGHRAGTWAPLPGDTVLPVTRGQAVWTREASVCVPPPPQGRHRSD